jgi:hypothetical protein
MLDSNENPFQLSLLACTAPFYCFHQRQLGDHGPALGSINYWLVKQQANNLTSPSCPSHMCKMGMTTNCPIHGLWRLSEQWQDAQHSDWHTESHGLMILHPPVCFFLKWSLLPVSSPSTQELKGTPRNEQKNENRSRSPAIITEHNATWPGDLHIH